MKIKFTAFLIAGFCSPLFMYSQKSDMASFDKLVYVSKTDSLPYRLLKPPGVSEQKKYPLIIFFHGAGERGRDNEAQLKHVMPLFLEPKNRDQFPCFVVAPQCPEKLWWAEYNGRGTDLKQRDQPARPMKLFMELFDRLVSELPVDTTRIYVIGLSMGGYGTWDLISRFPNRFAAAVPICGAGDTRSAPRIRHIPIWAFHGALDKVVVPAQSRVMIKALQQSGGLPGYTEYPDVEHNSWDFAVKEPFLLKWLFAQQRVSKSKSVD